MKTAHWLLSALTHVPHIFLCSWTQWICWHWIPCSLTSSVSSLCIEDDQPSVPIPLQSDPMPPLQLHREAGPPAQRHKLRHPGHQNHHVPHHMQLYRPGEPHCAGGHMEKPQVPQPNVLLHRQPGALRPAGRSRLPGQLAPVRREDPEALAFSLVCQRGEHVCSTWCLYFQPPSYCYRKTPDYDQNEALWCQKELQSVPPHRDMLADSYIAWSFAYSRMELPG